MQAYLINNPLERLLFKLNIHSHTRKYW